MVSFPLGVITRESRDGPPRFDKFNKESEKVRFTWEGWGASELIFPVVAIGFRSVKIVAMNENVDVVPIWPPMQMRHCFPGYRPGTSRSGKNGLMAAEENAQDRYS